MTSTALEAFRRHVAAIEARDLDSVVAGYSPDAVLVAGDRIGRGRDYVRSVFAGVLDAAADLRPQSTVLDEGDVVYVSYRAARPGQSDVVGTDTFVVVDDFITVHTGYHTIAADDVDVTAAVTGQP